MTNEDGSLFEGVFENDSPVFGRCIYTSGNFYIGKRAFQIDNQSYTYVGEFLYGKRHGKGTYYFANGDKWKGTWRDDSQHGKGVWL